MTAVGLCLTYVKIILKYKCLTEVLNMAPIPFISIKIRVYEYTTTTKYSSFPGLTAGHEKFPTSL